MTAPKIYTRSLTTHQIDILATYGRLGRLSEVAEEMGLAQQTIKNELSTIYKTLAVRGIGAAIWAVFVDDKEVSWWDPYDLHEISS